jgi:para-aminobenzoate synthetase component 1
MINLMNSFGKKTEPFLFIVDFDRIHFRIIKPEELSKEDIRAELPGHSFNPALKNTTPKAVTFDSYPINYDHYKKAFNKVMNHIHRGDTYLLNLTAPTLVKTNLGLAEIFNRSSAPYKLLFKNRFVVFSPETFIRIRDNIIFSYPMKGTIRDDRPGADEMLKNDPKEIAEHNTIVDLIRNDLNGISKKVKVVRFRYLERIETIKGPILQTSSEITGELKENWRDNIGNLVSELLPAGSISGAPKQKTIEIIRNTENYDRGYFTGIFGYFDGQNLDSAVMIRFIENVNGDLYFKSGGGITCFSRCEKEYQELLDKVYLPIV